MAHGAIRSESFGQGYRLSLADRFGIWLSTRKIRSLRPTLAGLAVADVGCGYNALFVRAILGDVRRAFVIDVALADDLKRHDKVTAIEGTLPETMRGVPDAAVDLVVCNNVIEHLWEPLATLRG